MGCGELTEETIARVWRATHLTELHFAALRDQPSPMRFGMGGTGTDRAYTTTVTDPRLVRAIIAAASTA